MSGMPFDQLRSPGVLQALVAAEEESASFWSNCSKRRKGLIEPTSVLDKRRSPSPPTSSSTLSSSLASSCGGGGAASSDSAAAAPELHPVPPGLDVGHSVPAEKCGLSGGGQQHLEDWEAMLSDSNAPSTNNNQDQSFFRWIIGDGVENGAAAAATSSFGLVDPSSFGFDAMGAAPLPSLPLSLPSSVFLQDAAIEEKPLLFNPNLILNHHQQLLQPQNPSFFFPLPQFSPQMDDHHRHFPEPNANSLFLRRNQLQNLGFSHPNAAPVKAKAAGDEMVDQLFKVAELVQAGNLVGARGILARLNQQLPSPPVVGKPLFRSAFYFKEALLLLTNNSSQNAPLSTPLDVLLKLGTYKAFSEISPIVQFTNFTSIQAILEALNGSNHIHVVDFDIGIGGHWSSFMQELAHRQGGGGGATTSLKITAFASHSSHHPLELHLTRENLSHFAADLNIPFEFNLLSLDTFDPSAILAMLSPDDAIAVNFPIGSVLNCQYVPRVLLLVRELNPKIVVSVEHGCDRSELPFSHHFLHAFQSCSVLLDSVDASGANQDVANKIERYLVQPRIENAVLGRYRAVEKVVPWRNAFASVGFVPIQFSNFTETQAECLLKRVQVRGYQVEKRQASLFLCWQKGELVSVSAWRC